MNPFDPGKTTLDELVDELNEKQAGSIVLRTSNVIVVMATGTHAECLEVALEAIAKLTLRVEQASFGEEERN